MTALRLLHRAGALCIGSFVTLHLLNHLLALQGPQAHIAFMRAARLVYRHGVLETLLLACVLFQLGSGIHFLRARWGQRSGALDRLQAWSGAYLAFFLLVHVGAVMAGRLAGLDTNFHFAAAGLHIAPYYFFFVPYYFLAVLAIFAHLACAFHWLARARLGDAIRNAGVAVILAAGALCAALIVAAFAGAFGAVEIPPAYQAVFKP
ncbi:MAG: hypothetical protein V4582_09410 [Pseudomonadota bacterium]